MARSNATNASARANAAIGLAAPVPPDEYNRSVSNERLTRYAIPVLLFAMAVAICYSLIQHFASSHTETVVSFQKALKQNAQFKHALFSYNSRGVSSDPVLNVFREIEQVEPTSFVVIGPKGDILDSNLPENLRAPGGLITPEVAAAARATPEYQGLVTLADGTENLIHARSLADGSMIYAIQPMQEVTRLWLSKMIGIAMLVGAALIAIIALGVAYYIQAIRAKNADKICETLSERMQLALARGRCGIWDWQLKSGKIQWSASMFEMLGLPPSAEALTFADIGRLAHPDDHALLRAIDEAIRAGVGAIDQEFRLRHADGDYITVHARADIIRAGADGGPHLVGFALDVTEQRRLEMERRHADLRLRDAIESIPEAFVLWSADNRLIICNENYRQFHQIDEALIAPGMSYDEVHAAARGPGHKSVLPIPGESHAAHDHSYEAELADGRWLQVSERRTKDGGFVSIGTDVTARKEQANKLMENEQRLLALLSDQQRDRRTLELQAMKLSEMARRYREQFQLAQSATRAKSAFLNNMGHELKTPLNAIVGFAQVMEQKLFGPLGSARYEEYVRDVRIAGEDMLSQVNDLLQMSGIEAGKTALMPMDGDLGVPIGQALQATRSSAAAKSIDVVADRYLGFRAHFDAEATRQILTNLIGNAVKFSRIGSAVHIRVKPCGERTNIYVSDRGVGIPPEAIPSLGRPFEQRADVLNNGMRGSGLGLAIAVSLAAMQNGNLRIRSVFGQGTTVMLSVPNSRPASGQMRDEDGWSPGGTDQSFKKRADDDPEFSQAA